MKRSDIAHDTVAGVSHQLFETEAAIDLALTQIATFARDLPGAGRTAGFSATRGQRVYEQLAEAMVAQSHVRARIVEVHDMLAELKQDSFMRSVAVGGGSKDPPPGNTRPQGSLVVVARAG